MKRYNLTGHIIAEVSGSVEAESEAESEEESIEMFADKWQDQNPLRNDDFDIELVEVV